MTHPSRFRRLFVASLLFCSGIWLAGCGARATDPASVPYRNADPPVAASTSASPLPLVGPESSAPVALPPASPSAEAPRSVAPPLPKGTTVLHVGDSFVHSGLTQALRPKLEELGARYEVHAEKSTNSLDWAKRVPALISSMQPDLVIITLGGNEIASQHLDVEARAVKRIVEAIGNRPCVWTTPPLWREESGVFDTIQASLAPCRFFETDVVVGKFMSRRADKIHPTPEGGIMWANALFTWLMQERTGAPKPWSMQDAPASERAPKGRRGPLPHDDAK